MPYEVTTQRGPLSVRNGPGREFRLVSVLQKGAVVDILKKHEKRPGDVWCRVARGWVSGRFLTPVSRERGAARGQNERRPTPRFIFFNPRIAALEDQIQSLTQRMERAESLAYAQGQSAAAEGSRLYDLDSEAERLKRAVVIIEAIAIPFGGGGAPDQGMAGIETTHRLARMREFERNARLYENDVIIYEMKLSSIERELETLR